MICMTPCVKITVVMIFSVSIISSSSVIADPIRPCSSSSSLTFPTIAFRLTVLIGMIGVAFLAVLFDVVEALEADRETVTELMDVLEGDLGK